MYRHKGNKGPLVLFDMDGTLLRPDSWRENGVGYLYEGMADLLAPFIEDHKSGLLTGCEIYRIKGALRETDKRLERWIQMGHFYCEMGLVQLNNGEKLIGAAHEEKEMLDQLRKEMSLHYELFPGSEIMVTLVPRYELKETIESIKEDFLSIFPHWANKLTVTTSSEAVDFMPRGFTKANGIEMALDYGYYPIHFVADSWGDIEALEKIRDDKLGLAALVGQAKDDVKERWRKGLQDNKNYAVQLQGKKKTAIKEFMSMIENFH